MICVVVSPDFTKSSVFSLLSTATAMIVKRNMQKKKVTKSFFSMYQSIFFMNGPKVKEKLLRSCERTMRQNHNSHIKSKRIHKEINMGFNFCVASYAFKKSLPGRLRKI